MAILVELSRWVGSVHEVVQPPTYVGKVLDVTCRVDSLWECDRYEALVWDELLNAPRTVTVGGRRWMSASDGPPMHECAVVDATPEVLADYSAYVARATQEADTKQMYHDSCRLEVGSTVQVISGRKIKKGLKGIVTRVGESGYGKWAVVAGLPEEYPERGVLTATTNLVVIPDLSWWA